MKLTEYKNEDALELIADILEPTSKLFSDEKLTKLIKNGTKIDAIKYALKKHKSSIIEILARLDGVEPKKYEGNIVTITQNLLEIANDEELLSFFISQGQTTEKTSSGSVIANTGEEKK